MPKYEVDIYATYRIPVKVEAENMVDAMEKAEDEYFPTVFYAIDTVKAFPTMEHDEISEYLVHIVDDNGNINPEKSKFFDADKMEIG